MSTLSVIIITLNAQLHLANCLESVSWADEIIVVDAGSNDATVSIASNFTPHIFVYTDWQGFGVQKNRALAHASGQWVLSIDADEAVPEQLMLEIKQAIKNPVYNAWMMPRLSRYCGRWIKHAWGKDEVLRLIKREYASFSNALVHEKLYLAQGKTGKLRTPLLHFSFNSVEEVLHKLNQYSTAGAIMQWEKGKKSNLRTAIWHGLWAFIRIYIFKRGFLDGREGFMLALSNAEGTYYRYIKLLYLQENKDD